MPVPVWVPGQILGAGDVNAWMVPLTAYKLNFTQRNTTTTQAADPDLVLTFPQLGIWIVESFIRYRGNSGNNLSWGWQTSAASISGSVAAMYNTTGTVKQLTYAPWTDTTGLAQTTGTSAPNEQTIRFNGTVVVGTGGSLAFAWAQGASNATNMTVDAGSYLMAWRAN